MSHYTLTRHYSLRGYDWRAVLYDGEVYCDTGTRSCLPPPLTSDSPDVTPLFASGEQWNSMPVCVVCGCEHDYLYRQSEDE